MPLGMEGFCAILFHQFSVFYTMGLRIAALRFLPLLVFAVRTFVEDHFRIAFEGEDVRGDTIEEPAVVGDHDGAAGEILQTLLQRTQRIDVDVVGRLVQKQHITFLLECEGQVQAVALAARQHADFFS